MLSRVSACRRRGLAELYSLCTGSRTTQLAPRVPCRTYYAEQTWRSVTRTTQNIPQQSPNSYNTQPILPQNVGPEAALKEALEGRGAGLYQYLGSQLKAGNYKTVIELYDRYVDQCAEKKQAAEGEQERSAEVDPSLTQALLCAISAHAAEDSFERLLQAYIKTGAPRIPLDIREGHLTWSAPEQAVKEKIQSFIDDLTSAHFVLKPGDLARYLSSVKRTNMTRSLTRLYEGILNGITRDNPFISPDPSHQPRLPVHMTDSSWASFISAWVACQRPDRAVDIFHNLDKLGVRRGPATWTAYLETLYHAREYNAAIDAWKQMQTDGTEPDAPAYQFMTNLLFRADRPREALSVFAEFQQVEKRFEPPQVLAVYNSIVNGLLRSRLLPQAEQFLELMKVRGVGHDVVTYNSFLNHFRRTKDFKGLLGTMAKMEEEGVKGDVYTFSTILSSLLSAKRKDAVDVVLRCMKEQGIQANVAIYSAMIDDQLRSGDEAHWRAGMELLRDMEKNESIAPNNITYTTVLTHLSRPNWLPPRVREQYRREVMNNMHRRGLKFTLPDYNILIRTCFENPDASNVSTALGYYRAIKKREIPCSPSTYYILLSGLADAKEWAMAREIMKDITLKEISPSLKRVVDRIVSHTQ